MAESKQEKRLESEALRNAFEQRLAALEHPIVAREGGRDLAAAFNR